MASVSATCITLGTPIELSVRTNAKINNGRSASLVSLGWTNTKPFPSMRTSRLRICAAKPETLEKVSGIVRKQLALTPETQVTPETKFAELGADSLDTVEIVMELEEGFDITLDDENAEKISTIQEAADLIDKLVEAKA